MLASLESLSGTLESDAGATFRMLPMDETTLVNSHASAKG
jgi:hypothetical protein